MPFILDSSALHLIPEVCGGVASCGGFLSDLGDMITRREAAFCSATCSALKGLAPNGVHYAWARVQLSAMWVPVANWQARQAIVVDLEALMDFDLLDDDPELVDVMALAVSLTSDRQAAIIVTEDDRAKPDVVSTTAAAAIFGLRAMPLVEFGRTTGLDTHFT